MVLPTSWLFVKDNQSVWIVRPPDGFVMIVSGPGQAAGHHEFRNEKELQDFQVTLAEDLSRQGWLLWAFDRDRRTGTERRGAPRPGTVDRRRGSARVTPFPARPQTARNKGTSSGD
jgi:hypothetical protein